MLNNQVHQQGADHWAYQRCLSSDWHHLLGMLHGYFYSMPWYDAPCQKSAGCKLPVIFFCHLVLNLNPCAKVASAHLVKYIKHGRCLMAIHRITNVYYALRLITAPDRPALQGAIQTDVCVIVRGYTRQFPLRCFC